MRRQLSIRDVLLSTIGVLTLLMALFVVQHVYVSWQRLVKIQSLKEATLISDQLFDVVEKLSVERDVAFSLLHSSNASSIDTLQQRLKEVRQDVDRTLNPVIDELKKYNFRDLPPELEKTQTQFADLQKLRTQIDQDVALPIEKRNHDLPQLWFTASTSFITQTQDLWMKFATYYADIDPYVTLHMRFKHVLGIIMEYSGRQRALIGQFLAENTDPTPAEQALLLQWQGAVDVGWVISNALAEQGKLYPELLPYYKDAKSQYFTVYDMTRDIFYIPGAHHTGSYPIGVELWLDTAEQETDSLYALRDAALRKNHDYLDKLEAKNRTSIVHYSLLLLFALGLCLYSFRVVIYRVIRPIKYMVEALVDATEGKAVTIAPPTYSRQDEIGKLAHVLNIFQQNASEIKRTSDALNESEKKLYQAQKMEAIGNLTGGMAHDFNNLLGVIIGNLDILIDQADKNGTIQQLAQAAIDAALRGADLTRRLLAFARQQPLQIQQIDINKLVDDITKLLSRTLGEHIEIALELAPGVWPVVADPVQLESAITNLATNARDAMPNGGKIIITTSNGHLDADYTAQYPDVTPGDYAVIAVSDTGTGMPPEVISRIFEPFYTTKERGKGTGLGLAMVFGFMKQSGGHVSVYSEVGAGTTFRLYLPRAAANTTKDDVELKTSRIAGGHETILVVEDNDAMRRVAVRQLKELGYTIFEAENAAGALEVLETNAKIDLLFTDIVMPGKINGMELARTVMERWPSIKVILTSGFPEGKLNGHGDITAGLRLLNKPYRKQDLARMIREVLSEK